MNRNKIVRLNEEHFKDYIKYSLYDTPDVEETDEVREIFERCLAQNILIEGLIMSYPPDKVGKILQNKGIDDYGIKISFPWYVFCLDSNKKEQERSYQIFLYFSNKMENITRQVMDNLLQTMNACGWYFSQIQGTDIKEYDYDFLKSFPSKFTIIFEPKYDFEIPKKYIPDTLYHITRFSLLNRVFNKKQGLLPKDGSMISKHPERVYLFTEYPNDWKDIASNFKYGKGVDEKFCLLKIDGAELKRRTDFYIDPNSNTNKACYILEPIPSYLIELIDEE